MTENLEKDLDVLETELDGDEREVLEDLKSQINALNEWETLDDLADRDKDKL